MRISAIYLGAKRTKSGTWLLHYGVPVEYGVIPTGIVFQESEPTYEFGDSIILDVTFRNDGRFFAKVID